MCPYVPYVFKNYHPVFNLTPMNVPIHYYFLFLLWAIVVSKTDAQPGYTGSRLKPGEVSEAIWLNVALQPRVWEGLEGCARIEFDTVFVEKWNERSMTLRYVLKNTGNAAANLFPGTAETLINGYLVREEKLTRGAIPAGSTSLQKGRETLDGMLFPGQFLEGTVEISLKDRTRFSPNIVLEFDPSQSVGQCGPKRNVWIIRLRF